MNKYVTELKLTYDPFEPGAQSKEFFGGGERRLLVEQLIELSLEGNMLAAITGPLGSGKSTIAREIRARFGADAVCILVPATLFMNQAQFLEAVGKQFPKHKHIAAAPTIAAGITRLKQFAAELDLEAQSLILIVDDAHELNVEVLELIDNIIQGSGKSSVRVILLGERQLINLLQNSLTSESQANLANFELESFGTEDTLEYLQIKLRHAGLNASLPFTGGMIGQIQNSAAGIPGAINALAAEILSSESAMIPSANFADIEQVPAGKKYNFDAHDHMQFDLDMVDMNEAPEYIEPEVATDTDEVREGSLPVLIEYIATYRYPIAASFLSVALIITLFIWSADETPTDDNYSSAVATLADGGNVNRIQLTPPVPQSLAEAVAPAVEDIPVAVISNVVATLEPTAAVALSVPIPVPTPAAVVTGASSNQIQVIAASESAVAVVPTLKPAVVAKPTPAAAAIISGFEQELMDYPPNGFTIQILGSHSEANVQKFIAGKPLSESHGYYETRHQNKPWFVVVAGSYPDRASAKAVIDRLSPALRNMQPWIRSIGEIQRDIRQLNAL